MYVLAIWYRPEKRNFSQSVCILTLTAYSDTSDRTNLHNYTPFVIFTFHNFFLLLTGRKKLKDTRKKGLFFKPLDEIKELKYGRRSPIYWKVLNKPTSCLFFTWIQCQEKALTILFMIVKIVKVSRFINCVLLLLWFIKSK